MHHLPPIKNTRLIIVVALIAAAVLAVFVSWHRKQAEAPAASANLQVVATVFPAAEVVRLVAGDAADVRELVPGGVEPHDYEPTPGDLAALRAADVVVIQGGAIDPWAQRVAPELSARGVRVVTFADHVQGDGALADPHVWLDPLLVQKEAEVMRDALIAADVGHRDTYARSAELAQAKLQTLHERYVHGLRACRTRSIVTSHNAFGHLARRYGLTQRAVTGISPEEEPAPRELARLSDLLKKEGIRVVFTETLVSPRLAETLAREAGAETRVLNPIEGLTEDERAAGKTYISLMDGNLGELRTALECQ
jgi:zinc transport system substrate-binding protein